MSDVEISKTSYRLNTSRNGFLLAYYWWLKLSSAILRRRCLNAHYDWNDEDANYNICFNNLQFTGGFLVLTSEMIKYCTNIKHVSVFRCLNITIITKRRHI